jgi:hypothetical protein
MSCTPLNESLGRPREVVVVVANLCKKCNYYILYHMKIKGAVKRLENDRRGRPRDSFNDVQDIA